MQSPDQILTVAQMRAAEDALIKAGSSIESLMDLAGRGAADWVWRIAGRQRVTVLCGPGNNGGDGYVIARALWERGGNVVVVSAGEPRGEAARNARHAFAGEVRAGADDLQGEVFVDCLFGSGLSRRLSSDDEATIATLARTHRIAVAIDVPSGVQSDTGASLSSAMPDYDLTLALGAWKFAHVLIPAESRMGMLRLIDIGIVAQPGAANVLARPSLVPPAQHAHKYQRGLVAVVGGSMPGAAALAAEACVRAGAGYVRLSAPQPARASHAIVQSREPDFGKAKAILVGPGLGRDDAARSALVSALGSGVASVADADALWLLAEADDGLPAPAIMTPHEGEFSRLFGDIPGNKVERACAAAATAGSVVVYKGPDTVIAAPDGRTAVSARSSSWLSTAGTGDVLAGVCAARLAVTGDPFQAACEAVWLHGDAARRAGPAFAADDLILSIPLSIATCL